MISDFLWPTPNLCWARWAFYAYKKKDQMAWKRDFENIACFLSDCTPKICDECRSTTPLVFTTCRYCSITKFYLPCIRKSLSSFELSNTSVLKLNFIKKISYFATYSQEKSAVQYILTSKALQLYFSPFLVWTHCKSCLNEYNEPLRGFKRLFLHCMFELTSYTFKTPVLTQIYRSIFKKVW